jgi:hypothetical protein
VKFELPESKATVALLENGGVGLFGSDAFFELSSEDAKELCVQLNCHFARVWASSAEGRQILVERKWWAAKRKAEKSKKSPKK